MTIDEYIAKCRAEIPYLGALLDAIKDVPIGDVEQLDAILEAFPDEEIWQAMIVRASDLSAREINFNGNSNRHQK